jgi:hypothetical protein
MSTSIERQRKAALLRRKPAVYSYAGSKLLRSTFGGRELQRSQRRLAEALAVPGNIEYLLRSVKGK